MTDTFFFAPSLGGLEFFLFTVGGFFNKREYSGADWLDLLLCLFLSPSQVDCVVVRVSLVLYTAVLCFA